MSSGPIEENESNLDEFWFRAYNEKSLRLSQLQHEMAELANAFGQAIRVIPDSPPVSADELNLAIELFKEEANELVEALEDGDLVNAAKEVIDVLVTAIWAANAIGYNLQPLWDLVMNSNLAKAGGPKRVDGKTMKPEGWKPPDILGELKRQGFKC